MRTLLVWFEMFARKGPLHTSRDLLQASALIHRMALFGEVMKASFVQRQVFDSSLCVSLISY